MKGFSKICEKHGTFQSNLEEKKVCIKKHEKHLMEAYVILRGWLSGQDHGFSLFQN